MRTQLIVALSLGLLFGLMVYCQPKVKAISLRKQYAQPIEEWPAPIVDSGVVFAEMAVLPKNPNPPKKEQVALGKTLFFDPRLSSSMQIACASCHDPDNFWTDLREKSFGHDRQTTARNAMSLENIWAQPGPFFWDGRAQSLEHQALFPIESAVEMNQNPNELPDRLNKYRAYRELTAEAFGDSLLTLSRIQKAIAAFERTIRSKSTRYDKFLEGRTDLFTDQEIEGLHLFRTKARCMNCHNGPYLTNFQFHNEGQHHLGDPQFQDLGLYDATNKPEDIGKFKTPSLRNVMNTRPWMHNGLFDEMFGIIALYNQGMLKPDASVKLENTDLPLPPQDPLLKPLDLSRDEMKALEAFLHTLSSKTAYKVRPPELPQ